MKELPKAYEPQNYEDQIYRSWEESGYFNPDKLPGKRAKAFSIALPPPNVTGKLHLGHASMLSYQDIMIRYHRLKGDKTLWLPGMDHAAIATQNVVEKELKKQGQTRHDLGREKFLAQVNQFAEDSKVIIRNQLKKMGSSLDWSRERFTLDENLSLAVRTAFTKMYDDGLIYRGERVVNWCTRCQSTLADDEVEYKEEKAPFYYFKYGPVVIGTARPETKFSDKTIIVHPKDKRYKDLVGQEFAVEWINGPVKAQVIADPVAEMELGTGAMTITPAHSFLDFELAQKYRLPLEKIIDQNGNLTQLAGEFAGQNALQARAGIVKKLQQKGLVEKIDEEYVHNLSVCYRCGTPIEPLPSKQWFVAVNKKIPGRGKTLKQLAIEAVKKGGIKIIPDRFNKTYFQWMNNLHDWCVSRQIWYGHRIPVWYNQKIKKTKNQENKAEIYVGLEAPKGEEWKQDEDTLDTWFSSGLWTFSTLGWPASASASAGKPAKTGDLKQFHPTSVLETMYDILFFWVARMIIMSCYFMKEIPFKTVYLHAMVKDKEGRKMSKSLGNGIDPLAMINKFGADALRLSMIIGATPGTDLRLYEEKIAGYRNFVNKLWNISRYILNQKSKTKNKLARRSLGVGGTLADRWILSELDKIIAATTKNIEEFKFSAAGEELYEFTWNKLADWYLEIAKIEENKEEILLAILEKLLILWHPFCPFVTEAIWREMGKKTLLMVQSWPTAKKHKERGVEKDFKLIQEIITAIRNSRSERKVNPKDTLDCSITTANKAVRANLHLIEYLAKVKFGQNISGHKIHLSKADLAIALPLNNNVAAGNEADIANLKNYIKSQEQKLANQQFLSKAPSAVVKAEQEKLLQAKERLGKLK
ncbi:MAG: valine--tRNA ligase [Candidatus Komeilibacteria bacterium]|nr:valine--tRNA ligase [Candidatus Komeilibacteria bacterium]